jgi:CRP/FNR family transcriptional regulator, anaerobic regulatory protein
MLFLEEELGARVQRTLPFLQRAGAVLEKMFYEHAELVHISAGQHLLMEGQSCEILGFVLSGRARVYKMSECGREITLFRVEEGGGCILAASCILNNEAYPAFALAETDLEAVVLPANIFVCWVEKYPFWRDFVFQMMSERIGSVITLVEEVAFRRMDTRIAEYLAQACNGTKMIQTTHQKIAADLGTSREVVSRILKDFEHRGWIGLARNMVEVKDLDGLVMPTPV